MDEFRSFIEDYRATWQRAIAAQDVRALTRFFHVPYFAVGGDGGVTALMSEADIEAFNRDRLKLFLQDNAARWALRGCDPMALGTQGAFVTVNWEGRRADGSIARAWRHYYNLVRTPAGLKILVSTFSAGSHD